MARKAHMVLLVVLAAWTTAAAGQGLILPQRWMDDAPVIVPPRTPPLPIVSVKATARIDGLAATTSVEQTFHNPFPHRLEGMFLFPLPEDAAVTDFAMTIDGEEIPAELLPAEKAREIYEDIVRRQKDPALLEYLGRDTFQARIFPIAAGENKRIRLEYTQAVPADGGLAKFVFPLRTRAFRHGHVVPPPRPLPEPRPVDRDAHRPRGPHPMPGSGAIGTLGVDVIIDSDVGIRSVYSPSHDIDVHREGDHHVRVGFEASDTVPNDDFVLYYQMSEAMFGLNLVGHKGPADDEGTFMLLLAPKHEVREQEVAAKDMLFVFDTSGSMAGEKLTQAKGALKYALGNLNPGDRFNVVTFSTGVDAYEDGLVAVTPDAIARANNYVDDIKARGGTNISEALDTALAMMETGSRRPKMVLFLTDGQPTVGETRVPAILETVGQANDAKARLFVFGVGHDVNVTLLDRLSLDNHGTRTYVRPEEDIEVAVSSLYEKIASPVLSDLRLDFRGVKVSDLHPGTLPDLFRGSQLTVLGRYTGSGPVTVVLRGNTGTEEVVFEYSADLPARERGNAFAPRLWATRHVGYLLEQIRLHGEDKELVEEVKRLATEYGILTPYTSYLVLEPGMQPGTVVEERLRAGRGGGGGGPAAMDMPAPAAPAAGPTGEGAVARSEAERDLAQAARGAQPQGDAIAQAAGRTFYLIDDTWVDATFPLDTEGLTVVRIQSGSDAYFDLLTLREELPSILALGERVKVRFGDVLLVIGDDGDTTLSDAARAALAQ